MEEDSGRSSYKERLQEVYRTLEEARTKKESDYDIPYGCDAPDCDELDDIAAEYISKHAVSSSCHECFPREWVNIVWK